MDDTLIAAAYDRYMSERIGTSGFPLRLAGDAGKADGWVVDESTVDWAQTALNKWNKERDSDRVEAVIPSLHYERVVPPWERQ